MIYVNLFNRLEHIISDFTPTCVGDQPSFKMPAEDVPEDVLAGEEYPDGKMNLFLEFVSQTIFICCYFNQSFTS